MPEKCNDAQEALEALDRVIGFLGYSLTWGDISPEMREQYTRASNGAALAQLRIRGVKEPPINAAGTML